MDSKSMTVRLFRCGTCVTSGTLWELKVEDDERVEFEGEGRREDRVSGVSYLLTRNGAEVLSFFVGKWDDGKAFELVQRALTP